MTRQVTKRQVRDFLDLALGEHLEEWGIPNGWDIFESATSGDGAIHIAVNGKEFLVMVSIPRPLHGRGGPKKPNGEVTP